MSYTFKPAANAKYHNIAPLNGRLLVADDVKFSYDHYDDGPMVAAGAWLDS